MNIFSHSKQSLVIFIIYCDSDTSSVMKRLSSLNHQRWIEIREKSRVDMWKWHKFNLLNKKSWQTVAKVKVKEEVLNIKQSVQTKHRSIRFVISNNKIAVLLTFSKGSSLLWECYLFEDKESSCLAKFNVKQNTQKVPAKIRLGPFYTEIKSQCEFTQNCNDQRI